MVPKAMRQTNAEEISRYPRKIFTRTPRGLEGLTTSAHLNAARGTFGPESGCCGEEALIDLGFIVANAFLIWHGVSLITVVGFENLSTGKA